LFADLDTTKLDITVLIALAGYTAFRVAVHIAKGYLPKPAFFMRREGLLTVFGYTGVVFLVTALVTTLWVNPWWTVFFVLFFTAILGDRVVITLFRKFTYIFSLLSMLASVYLFCRYIV